MANLQQCLLQYSVQPPRQRRRRRKRNKGRKAMTPLNNSIIQHLCRSLAGSNGKSSIFRPNTPGGSTVKPAIEEPTHKPTVEKPAIEEPTHKPTVKKPAIEPTIQKLTINQEFQRLTASQNFEKSIVNQTIDLCSDDSSNETLNINGDNEPCVILKENVNVIDISEDVPDENEIIVLPNDETKSRGSKCPHIKPSENKSRDTCSRNAEPANNRPSKHDLLHSRSENKCPLSKSPERKRRCITPPKHGRPKPKPACTSPPVNDSETIVIDISDDGSEGDPDLSEKNDTNDEILVIGSFTNTSKPKVVSTKKIAKNIHKKLSNEQLMKLKQERLRNALKERLKKNPMQGSSTSEYSNKTLVKLRRRIKARCFTKILQDKKEMEVNILDTIKYQNLILNNKASGTELSSGVGANVYVNAPVYIPTSGPRPIMIDGSNVAFTSDNPYKFSCKRLSICIKYFKEKGHKVTAFVPQFRVQSNQSDDPGLLDQLVRSGDVVLTPSKVIDGKLIVPYDDRFIVQAAVLKGGVIISRDNFKDLLEENPTWAETIKYRTLAYTWVDDVLMFPSDPLGLVGPTLEEFLSFN